MTAGKKEQKTIMRNVDEPITAKEKTELTDEFLKLDHQFNQTDAAMKRSQSQFKAQKEELDGKINSIKDTLRTGKITRQVECRVEYYPSQGKKDIIRIDKDELVTSETMTRKDFDDYQESVQTSLIEDKPENQSDASDDDADADDNLIYVGMVFRKLKDHDLEEGEDAFDYASVIEIGDDEDPITVRLEERDKLETIEELSKFGWEPDPDFVKSDVGNQQSRESKEVQNQQQDDEDVF